MVRQALGDRYHVEREIGRGGAARVFLAKTPTGVSVALKVLHPELLVSVTADRFLREIRLVSQLDHPNIGRLLDSGECDWLVYYVMPYVEGPSLKAYLTRYGRLSLSDTLRSARDLLQALGHAHERAIIHRDVKPDNIMLAPTGVVLLDFGIARAIEVSGSERLTRSGIAVGTSSYMSPEQIAGAQDIDYRSDLYSLGCVLFECLAGRPPFQHQSEVAVLQMHRNNEAPDIATLRLDAPAEWPRVISRALAKDREERWGSAREMLAALPNDPTE
jgi:eukaryotic-like serine/threonine-protein kinase